MAAARHQMAHHLWGLDRGRAFHDEPGLRALRPQQSSRRFTQIDFPDGAAALLFVGFVYSAAFETRAPLSHRARACASQYVNSSLYQHIALRHNDGRLQHDL